jgi:hypothetical protein
VTNWPKCVRRKEGTSCDAVLRFHPVATDKYVLIDVQADRAASSTLDSCESPLTRESPRPPLPPEKFGAPTLEPRPILKIDLATRNSAMDCFSPRPNIAQLSGPELQAAVFRAVTMRTVRSIVSLPWTAMSLATNGALGGTRSTKGAQQS